MICPKCKTTDALLLFNSYLCTNKKCAYYDVSWSKEVADRRKEEIDGYDTYAYTSSAGTDTYTYTSTAGTDTVFIEWGFAD